MLGTHALLKCMSHVRVCDITAISDSNLCYVVVLLLVFTISQHTFLSRSFLHVGLFIIPLVQAAVELSPPLYRNSSFFQDFDWLE